MKNSTLPQTNVRRRDVSRSSLSKPAPDSEWHRGCSQISSFHWETDSCRSLLAEGVPFAASVVHMLRLGSSASGPISTRLHLPLCPETFPGQPPSLFLFGYFIVRRFSSPPPPTSYLSHRWRNIEVPYIRKENNSGKSITVVVMTRQVVQHGLPFNPSLPKSGTAFTGDSEDTILLGEGK